jgi:hypothetical protein
MRSIQPKNLETLLLHQRIEALARLDADDRIWVACFFPNVRAQAFPAGAR